MAQLSDLHQVYLGLSLTVFSVLPLSCYVLFKRSKLSDRIICIIGPLRFSRAIIDIMTCYIAEEMI